MVAGGLWFSCEACDAHGDIITFGAQIWNLSLPDTLEKFSDLGVLRAEDANNATPEYLRLHQKFEAVEQFWADTSVQTWCHGDDLIACRLREFGLRHETTATEGIIGVAHYDQVSKLCSALGRSKPNKMRDDGAFIVYPFYDLPKRLTGFLLSQYNETFESRQNFIPVHNYKQRPAEAGYFLLPKLMEVSDNDFRGTQFVSEDFYWVVQTQIKYAARHNKFLPLVASYSGPEAESYGVSWSTFLVTPRIFHAKAVTPNLISRACHAKGYVSTAPTKLPTPAGNLISIRAHTKTWQESLKDTLVGFNEISAKSFAGRLTVPPDKLNAFFEKMTHPFSPGFADQVLAELRSAPTPPQQKWLVIERDSGWWSHSGKHIINVRPKITQVIHADTGEKMYVGTVTTDKGEVFSFTDSAKKIEAVGLLAYCNAILAPHKKLVVYDKLWNARSHMFALQMHLPDIVNVSTRYGWDKYNRVFRFDQYEITDTGNITPLTLWPKKSAEIKFDAPLPVAPLPVRDFLTPAHENSLVWAVVTGVISQLIAPALNKDASAVAVPPESFEQTREILAALCCGTERATAPNKHAARGFFERFKKELPWPVLVFNTFSDDILSNIVPYYFNQPLLVRLSPTAAAAAPGYGWTTIKATPQSPAGDFRVLNHVLPAFIQYLLTTGLRDINERKNIYGQTLSLLHTWLTNTYGSAFNLDHARQITRTPKDAHIALFEELQHAFLTEKIVVLPQPRRKDQARNFVLRQQDWWISRHAVDRHFYLMKSPPPNWMAVVDLLRQNRIYTGEKTIHNMTGVIVNLNWCDQFWSEAGTDLQTETG